VVAVVHCLVVNLIVDAEHDVVLAEEAAFLQVEHVLELGAEALHPPSLDHVEELELLAWRLDNPGVIVGHVCRHLLQLEVLEHLVDGFVRNALAEVGLRLGVDYVEEQELEEGHILENQTMNQLLLEGRSKFNEEGVLRYRLVVARISHFDLVLQHFDVVDLKLGGSVQGVVGHEVRLQL